MATRSRIRRLILITGTLLSLLIVAAFVVSGFWFVAVQLPTTYGPCLWLTPAAVTIVLDAPMTDMVYVEHMVYVEPEARLWLWASLKSLAAGSRFVELPLWALFLAIAGPTLLIWRFWPKPVKPGYCKCGYDLTGLTEPRCPECGQPFAAKGDAEFGRVERLEQYLQHADQLVVRAAVAGRGPQE